MIGGSAIRPHLVVWLLLLAAVTLFAGLGRPAITDSDEAFYAEAAREMIARGDWITPYFNGQPRFEKPILFYWLIAATYAVAGVSEAAARVWAALSGLGLVLVTWMIGRRWYGTGPGLVAGAIAATSFGTFWMARQALPDLPVTFFITVATWAAIEAIQIAPDDHVASSSRRRRTWLFVCAAAMSLGLLTKGPVAVVLPLGIVLLVVAATWRMRARLPFSIGDLAAAALVFLAIATPWYLAVTLTHGVDYLWRFFVSENVVRFATDRFNEPRPYWFYVPIALGGLLPWTPLLLLWVAPLARLITGRRRLAPVELVLGLWALVPFAFYTVSIGKQPRYILPCLTPLAILLGASVWRRISEPRPIRRDVILTAASIASGAVIVLVGALVLRARPLFVGAAPDWSATGAWVTIVAGLVAVASSAVLRPRAAISVLAGASATMFLALHASVMSLGRPEPVEVVAAAVRAQTGVSTLCTCGAFTRNLGFYTHMKTVTGENPDDARRILESAEPALAVVVLSTLEEIERTTGRQFTRLAEVNYLDIAALRAGDLLEPDPTRLLHRIVLVGNR